MTNKPAITADNSNKSEENEVFIEMSPKKKSYNGSEERQIQSSKRRRNLLKIRFFSALALFSLLLAISLILYFAVVHFRTNQQQSTTTESSYTNAVTTSTGLPPTVTSGTTGVAFPNTSTDQGGASTQAYQPDVTSSDSAPTQSVTQQFTGFELISGDFTYYEAVKACDAIKAILALKQDMEQAYKDGFEKCQYGWLRDLHSSLIMQVGNPRCGGGNVGVTYSGNPHEPTHVISGAYCVNKPAPTSHQVASTQAYQPDMTSPESALTKSVTQRYTGFELISGDFTYYEAVKACDAINAILALKQDMEQAYKDGFEKCQYGWLRDLHSSLIMQVGNPRCGGGKVGVTYSGNPHEPNRVISGAYCVNKPGQTSHQVASTQAYQPDVTSADSALTKSVTQRFTGFELISGDFTYYEAVKACDAIKAILALKQDMEQAYKDGFEKCQYGWLRDLHSSLIMQVGNPRCGGGKVGVTYSGNPHEPNRVISGAYCVNKPADLGAATPGRTPRWVNWWVRVDPSDVYDLEQLLSGEGNPPHGILGSVRSVYPCCGFFNITHAMNRTFVKHTRSLEFMKLLADAYKETFPGITVMPHVHASYDSMITHGAATTNRTNTIDDIVNKALLSGIDGVIIDYEPTEDYTENHTISYRNFLDELNKKMKSKNLKVGFMLSDWGILKYYDVYADLDVEMFASMGNTYYGSNIARNKINVDNMKRHIATQRLQIGLGSMIDSSKHRPKVDYKWDKGQLGDFLNYVIESGLSQLNIWPARWGSITETEKFFVEELRRFAEKEMRS